ncbi:hypothetical protein FOA52_002529 [Chlamydomonas sp. UWO 241]|nr:hypothetical protein FOA52_002529 [Chlamydomonas sp. UWO 241]
MTDDASVAALATLTLCTDDVATKVGRESCGIATAAAGSKSQLKAIVALLAEGTPIKVVAAAGGTLGFFEMLSIIEGGYNVQAHGASVGTSAVLNWLYALKALPAASRAASIGAGADHVVRGWARMLGGMTTLELGAYPGGDMGAVGQFRNELYSSGVVDAVVDSLAAVSNCAAWPGMSAHASEDLRSGAMNVVLGALFCPHQPLTRSQVLTVHSVGVGDQSKSTLQKLVDLLDPACATNHVPLSQLGRVGIVINGDSPEKPRTPFEAALCAVCCITGGLEKAVMGVRDARAMDVRDQVAASGVVPRLAELLQNARFSKTHKWVLHSFTDILITFPGGDFPGEIISAGAVPVDLAANADAFAAFMDSGRLQALALLLQHRDKVIQQSSLRALASLVRCVVPGESDKAGHRFAKELKAVGIIDNLVSRVTVGDAEMRYLTLDMASVLTSRFKSCCTALRDRGFVASLDALVALETASPSARAAKVLHDLEPSTRLMLLHVAEHFAQCGEGAGEGEGGKLKLCSKCNAVRYCSQEC